MFNRKAKIIICGSILLSFLAMSASLLVTSTAKGRTKIYNSGQAITHNGQLVFGTANLGQAEIFTLSNNKIVRTALIKNIEPSVDFNGLLLNKESGGLFAYAADDRSIYKYDLNDLYHPVLVSQANDSNRNRISGLEKANGDIASIGTAGIVIWNTSLQKVNNANLINPLAYNIDFSPAGGFIFNINNDVFSVYNTPSKNVYASFNPPALQLISKTDISVNDNHNRKVYNDDRESLIYLVDDEELRQMDIAGNTLKAFNHSSELGYDVVGLPEKNHVFFSDGIGVVKIDKGTMKPVKWVYTAGRFGSTGWAMGLSVTNTAAGERLVLFNNSSIVVFDESLKPLDSFAAHEEEDRAPLERLSLRTDMKSGVPNTDITLSGTGFGASEGLIITLANITFTASADNNGRFTKVIRVPEVSPAKADIKVTGKITKQTYSISFIIEAAPVKEKIKPIITEKPKFEKKKHYYKHDYNYNHYFDDFYPKGK